MALNKEEIAADLVWRYVEHVRAAGPDAVLTREELRGLVEVLDTASILPESLSQQPSADRDAVRNRVFRALGSAQPASAGHGSGGARPSATAAAPHWLTQQWRFYAVTALAAALAVCVATVPVWHRPPTLVKVRAVPRDLTDIHPMTEQQADELIPVLVRHRPLERHVERDLLWHMLVCPRCFNSYVKQKSETQVAGGDRSTDLELAAATATQRAFE